MVFFLSKCTGTRNGRRCLSRESGESPPAIRWFCGSLAALRIAASAALATGPISPSVIAAALPLLILAGIVGSFFYTTRRGKFIAWADLLDQLNLRGDERILDLGCGRGAVLLLAAQRLTSSQSSSFLSANSSLIFVRPSNLAGFLSIGRTPSNIHAFPEDEDLDIPCICSSETNYSKCSVHSKSCSIEKL